MDFSEKRAKAIRAAKGMITESYENEEHILIQAINALGETTKSYNLMCERLSEWYGIYFPEIKPSNHKELTDLAITMCGSNNISAESISAVVNDPGRADMISRKASETIGRKITEDERGAILAFATMAKSTEKTIADMDAYIKSAATRIMPNVTYITDDKIASELLSKAGGMKRLSVMPASTVQLLGAEKALFKHIKFGSRPPKYGIIFKLPDVTNAPKDKKGRIARVYATKICIALKADFFSKRFIAEKLKADLNAAIARINATESRPKPQAAQQFRRERFGQYDRNKYRQRPDNRRNSFRKPAK